MCGINGFSWSDEAILRRMNSAISHRGPDNDGVFVDGRVSLGNRRLAVIDLSEKVNQPMSNENGDVWITFNGEIYNFTALRENLLAKGHIFKSHSDVETILHLYEEEGTDCVRSLRGMFAFCIYDTKRQLLFLARDRVGVKPLYYYCHDDKFIFSSEIRGIDEHHLPRRADDEIVFDYLYFGRVDHSEKTFFKNIFRIPPAHTAIYDLRGGELRLSRYWDINLDEKRDCTLSQAKEQLASKLHEVVRMHTVADVPIGSCLSGGMDSSTIAFLIKQLDSVQFASFSAIYPGSDIDESLFIYDLAKQLGIDTKTVIPNISDLYRRYIEFIDAQEEPVASSSPFAQFKVMELAKTNGAKVLLDGQGGDELFAGYPHYLPSLFLQDLRRGRLISLLKKVRKSGLSPLLIGLSPPSLKEWFVGRNMFGASTD